MDAFDRYLHRIIMRAEQEARDDASATIEAHHLLLAIAGERHAGTQRLLGLDRAAVRDALDREFEHSLSTVGVSATAFDFPAPSGDSDHPKAGASMKLVLERSFGSVARKKDLRPEHLLLGIALAEVGTVPRALAIAGVDQAELRARVLRALEAEGE